MTTEVREATGSSNNVKDMLLYTPSEFLDETPEMDLAGNEF